MLEKQKAESGQIVSWTGILKQRCFLSVLSGLWSAGSLNEIMAKALICKAKILNILITAKKIFRYCLPKDVCLYICMYIRSNGHSPMSTYYVSSRMSFSRLKELVQYCVVRPVSL